MAYAKAKEVLDQEERDEKQASWLEPDRTATYIDTGTWVKGRAGGAWRGSAEG